MILASEVVVLQFVMAVLCPKEVAVVVGEEQQLSRDDFPPGFIFGAGTSAHQVEGAAAEDGRSPSIWDNFTHAGRMIDSSNGDAAADGYHKYKEDVKLMADTGLDSYRFSISWSRLLPYGRGAVNPKGLRFYNNLIDELVKSGIEPHVSLYHLDLPQLLEDEYAGWLSPKIVDDFTAYANVCFKEFGDRVSRWTTIVEPNVVGMASYDSGIWPPNRCSPPFGSQNCTSGNSTTEPYVSIHNMLLAHASVVSLYRTKYQCSKCCAKRADCLNVYAFWCYPFTYSAADAEATQRTLDFNIGWIVDPLMFGDYPEVMKKIVDSRLPSFSKYQSQQIKGSFDYIGINYYTSVYVIDNYNATKTDPRDYTADVFALLNQRMLHPTAASHADPSGLQYLLEYFRDAYGNPPTFVEENGYRMLEDGHDFNDTARIDFLSGHINSSLTAIRNGANVRGYFVWSFVDVFEFLFGYQRRYGLYYVNFDDERRERRAKSSASWYSRFLGKKTQIEVKLGQQIPLANSSSAQICI